MTERLSAEAIRADLRNYLPPAMVKPVLALLDRNDERIAELEARLVEEHDGNPGREEARRWEMRADEQEAEAVMLRERIAELEARVAELLDQVVPSSHPKSKGLAYDVVTVPKRWRDNTRDAIRASDLPRMPL